MREWGQFTKKLFKISTQQKNYISPGRALRSPDFIFFVLTSSPKDTLLISNSMMKSAFKRHHNFLNLISDVVRNQMRDQFHDELRDKFIFRKFLENYLIFFLIVSWSPQKSFVSKSMSPKKHTFFRKYLRNNSTFLPDCFWSPRRSLDNKMWNISNWKSRTLSNTKISNLFFQKKDGL